MDDNMKCLLIFMLIAAVRTSTAAPSQTVTSDVMPRSSISQVSCDFDSGLCNWKQDNTDIFDWTRSMRATTSSGTGPSVDHSGAGYYIYIEASAPRRAGDKARLVSPEISPAQQGRSCFTFWYDMNGRNIGYLNVYIQSGPSLPTHPIWYKNGTQGIQWIEGSITITADKPFRIVLEGIRGNGYLGDIAVDDVKLTEGSCGSQIIG